MTKPIIAVLEDMEVRVEWLKNHFPDAEIMWSVGVDEFIANVAKLDQSRLILFLLDHDLGGPFFGSADELGQNGHDATRQMGPWARVPAIIWSINGEGANNMLQELQDKGFVAAWIPFHRSLFPRLEAAIKSQVSP